MISLSSIALCSLCLYFSGRQSQAFTMNAPLTRTKVADTIDEVLASTPPLADGLSLRRAKDDDSWGRILKYAHISDREVVIPVLKDAMNPWFFGVEIFNDNDKMCGFLTLYVAYSSWNGKILYPDQMQYDDMNDAIEQRLLRVLAKIADSMDFARLTWTHVETPEWHSHGSNRPEMHGEVLTLCMDRDSIGKYVSESFPATPIYAAIGPFENEYVRSAINLVLDGVNESEKAGKFRIRLSSEADTEIIEQQVHGLADYVKEPDAVLLSGKDYKIDGFSSDPLFYCLTVETANADGEMQPCGFAFFFFGYQLGKGRFVHLEDLFIESKYRQNGGGSLAMATLAKISQTLDLSNFYWQALDWNTGALTFYQKMGAKILDGVKTSRYCSHPDDALKKFAEDETE